MPSKPPGCARGEEGELHTGVHSLASGGFRDRLLDRFRSLHAGVGLHITEGTARDAQFMVREDQLDVAFMACTHEIPDLHSRIIWHDRLMVVMREAYPLAQCDRIAWRDLATETFLVREGGIGPQLHDLIVVRAAGKWPIPTILRCDVGAALGLGFAFMLWASDCLVLGEVIVLLGGFVLWSVVWLGFFLGADWLDAFGVGRTQKARLKRAFFVIGCGGRI
ncbi:LysR substrate-binding domain-containing protein [Rhizobium sp. CNPSo 3968]|nr:LysR substrate-binding domain-containing protein [Rhizobium sp. CNPSo 3968]